MALGRVTGGSLVSIGCKTMVSAKNIVGETCSFGLLSACSVEDDRRLAGEGHSFICSSVSFESMTTVLETTLASQN